VHSTGDLEPALPAATSSPSAASAATPPPPSSSFDPFAPLELSPPPVGTAAAPTSPAPQVLQSNGAPGGPSTASVPPHIPSSSRPLLDDDFFSMPAAAQPPFAQPFAQGRGMPGVGGAMPYNVQGGGGGFSTGGAVGTNYGGGNVMMPGNGNGMAAGGPAGISGGGSNYGVAGMGNGYGGGLMSGAGGLKSVGSSAGAVDGAAFDFVKDAFK